MSYPYVNQKQRNTGYINYSGQNEHLRMGTFNPYEKPPYSNQNPVQRQIPRQPTRPQLPSEIDRPPMPQRNDGNLRQSQPSSFWNEYVPIEQIYYDYLPIERKQPNFLKGIIAMLNNSKVIHEKQLVPIPKLRRQIEFVPVETMVEDVEYVEVEKNIIVPPQEILPGPPHLSRAMPYRHPTNTSFQSEYRQSQPSLPSRINSAQFSPMRPYNPIIDLTQPSPYLHPPPSGYRYLDEREQPEQPRSKYFFGDQKRQHLPQHSKRSMY